MPSSKIMGFLMPKKKILKVFAIYGHNGNLGHVSGSIRKSMSPLPKQAPHRMFALIGKAASENMFYNNGHITPQQGQTTLPGVIFFFQIHTSSVDLVICCNFSELNDFAAVFPMQTHRRPHLNLP